MAGLLAQWGLPADARLAAASHGTNNRTMIVSIDSPRFVLRISQKLTADQVRAEHRLLARLRGANLPFAVPEPRQTVAGDDLVETGDGPATLMTGAEAAGARAAERGPGRLGTVAGWPVAPRSGSAGRGH